MNIQRHEITLSDGTRFRILHNLEEYEIKLEDMLEDWEKASRDMESMTAQSLCDFALMLAKERLGAGIDVYAFPDRITTGSELQFEEAKNAFMKDLYVTKRGVIQDADKHDIRMNAMRMVETLEDDLEAVETALSTAIQGIEKAVQILAKSKNQKEREDMADLLERILSEISPTLSETETAG